VRHDLLLAGHARPDRLFACLDGSTLASYPGLNDVRIRRDGI
jgi:hypothetical protein